MKPQFILLKAQVKPAWLTGSYCSYPEIKITNTISVLRLKRITTLPLIRSRNRFSLDFWHCQSYSNQIRTITRTSCKYQENAKEKHIIYTMRNDESINDFPVWGLLPKKETGVIQFLNRYPEYDGRGIVIGIFDSGVDPGAAGLQKTSDGKVKIIERLDCSGAGDVDTSTIVKAVNGEIKGLTGRTLKIPENWSNPTNKYHIGVKNAFELYPKDLLERIRKQRKEKLWDPLHNAAQAEANKELQEFEAKNNNTTLNGVERLEKENLEAKVNFLTNAEKKYKDLGPAYDCIVFHDGEMWRSCIDTTEEGNLEKATLLGEYSLTHEYATLTKEDQLNYSVNVYNEGNLLEIVCVCSSHGTHVASIAAACFPDEPEKNGIAPGAQIISCSIGDIRLHAMETGTALVRAMIRAMQKLKDSPIHIINTSYGEHAKWSSSGRICELMAEVVNKHGIVWVASASNKGPALCTIGTPPDIATNSMISVGAYVSPEMMVAEYSLRDKLPGMPYTWSSRGPTIDGDVGVTVCAPGGAITSVPTFTLTGCQLFNGTSMASPHVTGAIALLLSGMEKRNLKYSPHSVKRALQNSALYLHNVDPFAQGSGLLQVEKAFECLCSYSDTMERDVRFSIQCGPDNAKGIHMRCGPLDKPKEWSIRIKPEFFDESEPEEKVKFDLRLAFACSEPWVQHPSHLDLVNSPRIIKIRIDPTSLPDGAYTTSLRAYDVKNPEKGAVFQVQITVIKPLKVMNEEQPDLYFNNVQFLPNTIKRHFIYVPPKATWAVLTLKCPESGKTGKYVVQTVQLRPQLDCKNLETFKIFMMNSEFEAVVPFPVKGEIVLEVVIAKFWDSYGEMTLNYTLQFRGIKPDSPSYTMHASDGIYSMEVSSGPRVDVIWPVITLKQHVIIVRPSDSIISALTSPRDTIPPGRYIYENVLTYNFHIKKNCEITPYCPMLCDVLYESEFESQLWMLFDSNKQLLATGDAYPQKYSFKVEKGDFVIKMHVRHEKKDILEKLSDLPMLVSQKLPNFVFLDVYPAESDAICGKKMSRTILPAGGQTIPFYVAPLAADKISKLTTVGQYLNGSISFAKDEVGNKMNAYPFKYILTEPGKKNKNSTTEKNEKTKFEEYMEKLTELKIEWLSKLSPGKEANTLYEELKSANPDNLAVHSAMLQCLEPSELDKGNLLPFVLNIPDTKNDEIIERNKTIISVADAVINAVDKDHLLAYSGMVNYVGADANNIKTKKEKQKTALVDAYSRKGCALCRLHYLGSSGIVNDTGDSKSVKEDDLEPINDIWKELMKFSDPNDSKVIYFMMWHSAILDQYGRLAKYLQKLNEEKLSMAVDSKLLEVYKKLDWKHCEHFLSSSMTVKYPPSYRLF